MEFRAQDKRKRSRSFDSGGEAPPPLRMTRIIETLVKEALDISLVNEKADVARGD
jgi:hypothetical protein